MVSERRAWLVREHTAAEIRDILDCRAALEGYAARLAAERRTVGQARAIGIAARAGAGLTSPDSRARVEANDRFHDLVVAAAGNAMLRRLIEGSRLYHFNLRLAGAYTVAEMTANQRQHTEIANAIRAGDPGRAERAAREHIRSALDAALDKLDLVERPGPII